MRKFAIRPLLECQNRILIAKMRYWPSSNVKIGFRISKCDIRPEFECQNAICGLNSNVKIGFRMSKYDMRPEFECQNRISNVKMRYSAPV